MLTRKALLKFSHLLRCFQFYFRIFTPYQYTSHRSQKFIVMGWGTAR